ncbi:hypothetical protein ACFWEJ_17575 [Promicromonospora sp. NPDC060204]|uniref:hypothetical protein n=1 Tax=Promicromonospora sp. NPDC060204 TaxID=3347071 RepID=UPI0036559118
MTGSGRVDDGVLGEHWEQSLVGVTGAAGAPAAAPVRRRRIRAAGRLVRTRWARNPHRAVREHAGAADDNRLHAPRRARRRFSVPAIVLGASLVGSTAVLALSPVEAEFVALDCPAGVSAGWVDQYRDVLGLRLPDPRDHLAVTAPAGSVVAVTFTDAAGAAYPTVRDVVPGDGVLTVEPPRALSATERAQWRVAAVVSADGDPAATCEAPLP